MPKYLVEISDEAAAVVADFAKHKKMPTIEAAIRHQIEVWAMGVRAREKAAEERKRRPP